MMPSAGSDLYGRMPADVQLIPVMSQWLSDHPTSPISALLAWMEQALDIDPFNALTESEIDWLATQAGADAIEAEALIEGAGAWP